MKLPYWFPCIVALIILESCGDHLIKNSDRQKESIKNVSSKESEYLQKICNNSSENKDLKIFLGNWVGMFNPDTILNQIETGEQIAWNYSNKINLSIDEIKDDSVKGHSVVAGNFRSFKGTFTKGVSKFNFSVKEPGEDKYDGAFEFSIAAGDTILKGTWKSNRKIKIPVRKYELTKKIFVYNPGSKLVGGYVDWTKIKMKLEVDPDAPVFYDASYFATSHDIKKYNASVDMLTKEQVANMTKGDIFILRNAIYARHGYSFKNQQLRAYFDKQPWYLPISTDVKNQYTDIEKRNIKILLLYEQNAKEYYDVFGRG